MPDLPTDPRAGELERLLERTAVSTLSSIAPGELARRGLRRRTAKLASGFTTAMVVVATALQPLAAPSSSLPPVIGELPDVDESPPSAPAPGQLDDRFPVIIGAVGRSDVPGAGGAAPAASAGLVGDTGASGVARPGVTVGTTDGAVIGEGEAGPPAAVRWDFADGDGGWVDASPQHRDGCLASYEYCLYPFVPYESGFTHRPPAWTTFARPRPPQGAAADWLLLGSPEVEGSRGRLRVGYRWHGGQLVDEVRLSLQGSSRPVEAAGAGVFTSTGDGRSFARGQLEAEGILEAALGVASSHDEYVLSISVSQAWSADGAHTPSGLEVLWVEWIPTQ